MVTQLCSSEAKKRELVSREGTRSASESVSKSKHHIDQSASHFLKRRYQWMCEQTLDTLDSKESAARVRSAPAHHERNTAQAQDHCVQ
jgi:hypothetical protein